MININKFLRLHLRNFQYFSDPNPPADLPQDPPPTDPSNDSPVTYTQEQLDTQLSDAKKATETQVKADLYKKLGVESFKGLPDRLGSAKTKEEADAGILFATVKPLLQTDPDSGEITNMKERLEFSEYKKLKQVEKIAETSEQAHGMLLKVMGKMHERGKYKKERGIKNIVHTKEKDWYFIGIDEGAVLAPSKGLPRAHNKMLEECQYMLSHIARVRGALGFRIVFCTQYPTGDTLPRVVKQMANAKLGFCLQTEI